MSQTPNPRKIGLFMIVAFLIAIGGFITLHWDSVFPHKKNYIMYFEGSVKGLNIGSPVVFNGVPIGKVTHITILANTDATSFENAVTVEIGYDAFTLLDEEDGSQDILSFEEAKRYSQTLVDAGLRATIITSSLLTGQKAIDLNLHPGTPVNMKNRPTKKKVIEIPTLNSFTDELNKMLKNLPLEKTFEHFNDLIGELNTLIKGLNDGELTENLEKISASVAGITQKANRVFQNFDKDSKAMGEINQILHNLSETSSSLKNLVDYLERHPEALLKGK